MNPIYSIIAFTLSVILIVKQINVWRYRVLLSPGFYFACIWSIGFLGITIMHFGGILTETYPQYIDELNIYAGFTCLCFLLWTSKGRQCIRERNLFVHFPKESFIIIGLLAFIAAISELYRSGMGLESMGQAREYSHDILAGRSTIVNYATISGKVLSILAGYKLVEGLLKESKIGLVDYVFLLLPLVSNLFLSIVVGGRVDFVYSFLYYFIGASLNLPLHFKIKRRIIIYFSLCMVIIVSFITYVQIERAVYYGGNKSDIQQYLEKKSPLLGALYGPIYYMSASFVGYQYRRVDDVDLNHLGYGMYTFNGFINWTIPFGNQFGLGDLSIAKYMDIYYDNQHTYDFEREHYQSTHSGYIPIVKDFGIIGAFVCIFFLTLIAHTLFVGIQKKRRIKHMYQFFFFLLFLDYWVRMNYYGSLSSTILIPLYPLLIIDLLDTLIKKDKIKNNIR